MDSPSFGFIILEVLFVSETLLDSSISSFKLEGRGGTVGALAINWSTVETESAINSCAEFSNCFFSESKSEGFINVEKSSLISPDVFSSVFSSVFACSKSRNICSLKLSFSSSLDLSLKGFTSFLIIHNIIS